MENNSSMGLASKIPVAADRTRYRHNDVGAHVMSERELIEFLLGQYRSYVVPSTGGSVDGAFSQERVDYDRPVLPSAYRSGTMYDDNMFLMENLLNPFGRPVNPPIGAIRTGAARGMERGMSPRGNTLLER